MKALWVRIQNALATAYHTHPRLVIAAAIALALALLLLFALSCAQVKNTVSPSQLNKNINQIAQQDKDRFCRICRDFCANPDQQMTKIKD